MKVSPQKLSNAVNQWIHKSLDYVEMYCENIDGTFTGLDNSTGNCWVEGFASERNAIRWINHEIELDQLVYRNGIYY